jgi:hypothetical protein
MGTGYKPLQRVNYHDSRALSYEWFGVLLVMSSLRYKPLQRWFRLVMSGWESQWATVIVWLTYG